MTRRARGSRLGGRSIPSMELRCSGGHGEFTTCLAEPEDLREASARHGLHEIVVIGFCTLFCNGEDLEYSGVWPGLLN